MDSPLLALLIFMMTNCAATVHALPQAAGTPAARFWEIALPGMSMPEAIADLVQKGIDHSPLAEHYSVPDKLGGPKLTLLYRCDGACPSKADVPPGLFFHKEQVRVGVTMTFSFAPAVLPAILPRKVAEKLPFGNLTDVLSMFDIRPSSTAAAAVADTLSRCRPSAVFDEQKACATSLEDTVRSAMRILGTSRVSVVASALSSTGVPLGAHVIEAVSALDADRHVGCHVMPYPYAVYQCHMTGRPSKAYVISFRSLGEGRVIDLAAICHLDTSQWSPDYPAFEILHTQPGRAPVCHFLQYSDLLFGDKA
ncbi:unnamed protein product [Urochloa humidicola]